MHAHATLAKSVLGWLAAATLGEPLQYALSFIGGRPQSYVTLPPVGASAVSNQPISNQPIFQPGNLAATNQPTSCGMAKASTLTLP